MIAYCWRTGLIGFGQSVPRGAVEILRGKGAEFRRSVTVQARHGYDGALLVPGVPEAMGDLDAAQAVKRFQERCRRTTDAKPQLVWSAS